MLVIMSLASWESSANGRSSGPGAISCRIPLLVRSWMTARVMAEKCSSLVGMTITVSNRLRIRII